MWLSHAGSTARFSTRWIEARALPALHEQFVAQYTPVGQRPDPLRRDIFQNMPTFVNTPRKLMISRGFKELAVRIMP